MMWISGNDRLCGATLKESFSSWISSLYCKKYNEGDNMQEFNVIKCYELNVFIFLMAHTCKDAMR